MTLCLLIVAILSTLCLTCDGTVLPRGTTTTTTTTTTASSTRSITVKLLGNYSELFFYYLEMEIGTPAVIHRLTIDSGSSDMWLNKFGCQSCFGGVPSQWYSVKNSSSGSIVECNQKLDCNLGCSAHKKPQHRQCKYQVVYGGNLEIQSDVVEDIVSFPAAPSLGAATKGAKILFGAAFNVSQPNEFYRDGGGSLAGFPGSESFPDGLLGIGFPQLNELGTTPFLNSFMTENNLSNQFVMCLQDVGGTFQIGGGPPAPYSSPWQYTPITKKHFYQVEMLDVRVNGISLGYAPGIYNTPCIVDSGTPFMTIPTDPFKTLQDVMFALCSPSNVLHGICDVASANHSIFNNNCFDFTQQQIKQYPVITFHLDGDVILTYSPSQYLKPLYYCGVATQRGLALVPDPKFTVIGASMLQQYSTLYDRYNQRIGFSLSKGNCDNK